MPRSAFARFYQSRAQQVLAYIDEQFAAGTSAEGAAFLVCESILLEWLESGLTTEERLESQKVMEHLSDVDPAMLITSLPSAAQAIVTSCKANRLVAHGRLSAGETELFGAMAAAAILGISFVEPRCTAVGDALKKVIWPLPPSR